MLSMAIGLWLVSLLLSITLIDYIDESSFFTEILWALIVLSTYGAIVHLAGFRERVMQALTAIIGCGALLSVFFAFVYSGLGPFLGREFLGLAVYGFVIWSLSVKGHIIATAVSRRWWVGALIATAVFIVQLVINWFLSAPS